MTWEMTCSFRLSALVQGVGAMIEKGSEVSAVLLSQFLCRKLGMIDPFIDHLRISRATIFILRY